jgi:hypothetical protein
MIEKFKDFDLMISELLKMKKKDRPKYILINHAEVIGDNYEEVIRNLNKISETEVGLLIAGKLD